MQYRPEKMLLSGSCVIHTKRYIPSHRQPVRHCRQAAVFKVTVRLETDVPLFQRGTAKQRIAVIVIVAVMAPRPRRF